MHACRSTLEDPTGLLFGYWLDGKAGTAPWLMILFLVLGLVAGFRGVIRAVKRAEKDAES